jgi:hypothetical protein
MGILKNAGIGLVGAVVGARFNLRKGQVFFGRMSMRVARLLTPFYDVRRKRNGRVYFELRDRREDLKRLKRFRRLKERIKERVA